MRDKLRKASVLLRDFSRKELGGGVFQVDMKADLVAEAITLICDQLDEKDSEIEELKSRIDAIRDQNNLKEE